MRTSDLKNLRAISVLSVVLFFTAPVGAIPDPSAMYCTELGYAFEIRTDEYGVTYGVCVFPDDSFCSSWAYFAECYLAEPSGQCHWPCQALPCKQAGQTVYIGECCEGLTKIPAAETYDQDCNPVGIGGAGPICADCGNGTCEPWESKCNCPLDCRKPRLIYVDGDATGTNDGSSWADAYNFLQDALTDANSSEKPTEIRVAQGAYTPDSNSAVPDGTGDRQATFQLLNGVTLNGGYAGFREPDPGARDIEANETVLSGDLAGDDVDVRDPCDLLDEPTRAENSYHTVSGSGTDPTAVIDGFVITGGNAEPYISSEPMPYEPMGGGMYNVSGSPTINNCTLAANVAGDGGGIYNENSSPKLTNCAVTGNFADMKCERFTSDIVPCWGGYGGGIYNSVSSPTLTNCRFNDNLACRAGGGLHNQASAPLLTNCTFVRNRAKQDGGGMYNKYQSSPNLTNCTFSENSADSGGGMQNNMSYPILTNCTFSGNSASRAGGGMANYYASQILARCRFTSNWADDYGGGMYNWGSSPTLTNCTFSGNSTTRDPRRYSGGGAICNYSTIMDKTSPTLVNCTFVGNSAQNGNAINCLSYRHLSNVQLINCILWDGGDEIANQDGSTIIISYCDVRGGHTAVHDPCDGLIWGEGNIDADPCFADPGYWDPNGTPGEPSDDFWVQGDYQLKSQAGRWDANEGRWTRDDVTSPCIDAGNPMSPIGHEPFPNGGIINMGGYGGTAEASKSYFGKPPCQTIVAGDINGDCVIDLKDFQLMAFHWLESG